MLTPQRIIDLLDLIPHPEEGGFFRETYRAADRVELSALPDRYRPREGGAHRDICTQIYYLLTPETFSAMHMVSSDETFHHYLGDPVEQLWLMPDGGSRVVMIGSDLEAGQRPQVTVPHGVWQGARLASGSHGFALMGCTVAPGFEFVDYEMDGEGALIRGYPDRAALIEALTVSSGQHDMNDRRSAPGP